MGKRRGLGTTDKVISPPQELVYEERLSAGEAKKNLILIYSKADILLFSGFRAKRSDLKV